MAGGMPTAVTAAPEEELEHILTIIAQALHRPAARVQTAETVIITIVTTGLVFVFVYGLPRQAAAAGPMLQAGPPRYRM